MKKKQVLRSVLNRASSFLHFHAVILHKQYSITMKKFIAIIAIVGFAGNLFAQNAPKTAPAATSKTEKKEGKKHHHEHKGDHKR